MLKELQVIKLPTAVARNNAQVVVNKSGQMAYTVPYEFEHLTLMSSEGAMGDGKDIKRFDLYILSDDYIGLNWYVDNNSEVRKGTIDDEDYWDVRQNYKKIVATTNPFLLARGIPNISESFIQAYVSANGKIDKVLVEYEANDWCKSCSKTGIRYCWNSDNCGQLKEGYKPVLSVNNCVIISPVEVKTYSQEEVANLLYEYTVDTLADLTRKYCLPEFKVGKAHIDNWLQKQ